MPLLNDKIDRVELMNDFQIIALLMSAAILLVGAAQRLRIPYPIALVLGGAALGFMPGLNDIAFDPNVILGVVLPPILYYGAFWISFREFKRNAHDIFSLALGLVIATTLIVGAIIKWLLPDIPWALAFAFGAIVSPPDAVAATTILKRFSISSRLLTVLEGESLVNDAFALVLYKLAVIALLSGVFSWSEGLFEFIQVVVGGVLVGVLTGLTLQYFSSRYLTPVVGVMFSFTIPYITYIIADLLGVSGVLAVVINGLILSRMYISHHASLRRVLGVTSWDIFIIILNCFVFTLIGLQLSTITESMSTRDLIVYTGYAVLIMFVLIAVRMLWVYVEFMLVHYRSPMDSKLLLQRHQIFREGAILGWSEMRGIISLTAVLALPVILPEGTSITARDDIIYITFIVILLSLLIPGLTLTTLLRWLKIHHAPEAHAAKEARHKLLKLAEKMTQTFRELDEEERRFLLNYFQTRHRILEISSAVGTKLHKLELARIQVLEAQRQLLIQMGEERDIDDKLMKLLQLELDVEEAQSIRAEIK